MTSPFEADGAESEDGAHEASEDETSKQLTGWFAQVPLNHNFLQNLKRATRRDVFLKIAVVKYKKIGLRYSTSNKL